MSERPADGGGMGDGEGEAERGAGGGIATGGAAFLLIWGGQTLSLIGSSMTRFALLVWGWEATGRATTLSLLLFFSIGVTVLMSPLAGVVVDRIDRKRVMIFADLGAGLPTVALLALFFTGHLEVWHLYVAAAVAGGFETFQFPAYSAAVTLLLPKRHYARASGMISMANSGSAILGPALAGVLLPLVGFATVLLIDVATFLVAVFCLLLARIPVPPPVAEEEGRARPSLLHQMSYGFRYIKERKGLLGLQLLFAAGNFLLVFGVVLRAPLVLAKSGGNELVLGQVMAAAGLGGVLGGVLLTAWGGPKRRIGGVLSGWIFSAVGNVVLGLGRNFGVWVVGAFFYSFALTMTNGLNQSIWQSKVEPAVQGRVFATRRLIAQFSLLPAMAMAGPLADLVFEPAFTGGGPLAGLFGGLIGTGPGAGTGALIAVTGALAVLVTASGWLMRPVRNLEDDLPDHVAVG
ncbi:MAG TPA: MFS transporter [Thermoanaerobaculia bacterium]|nr:MFS transporter [Thermoanaerobaculia bacterium]